jgi:competence protein ComFB
MIEPLKERFTAPKNYMEDVVSRLLDDVLEKTNCCTCPVCRLDITAYALNQLPCKYVVTRKGEVYSKVAELEQQFRADVIMAIVKAIEVVHNNPRHETHKEHEK